MAQKRKKLKDRDHDDDLQRFKDMVDEIVELFHQMEVETRTFAWEHWNRITETLRDLGNHASTKGETQSSVVQKDGANKEKHRNYNTSITCIGHYKDSDSDPTGKNVSDVLQNISEKLQSYNEVVNTETSNQETLDPETSKNVLDSFPCRRSTRKRQVTMKMKELQEREMHQDDNLKKAERKIQRKNERDGHPKEEIKTKDVSDSIAKNDQKVIGEIIHLNIVHRNDAISHVVLSKTDNTKSTSSENISENQEIQSVTSTSEKGLSSSRTDIALQGAAQPEDTHCNKTDGQANLQFGEEYTVCFNKQNGNTDSAASLGNHQENVEYRTVHIECQQVEPNQHVCLECCEVFSSQKLLEKHQAAKHQRSEVKRSNTCDECGKTFCSSSNLKAHINLCHKGVRDFICEVCKKAFHSRSNLQRHSRTHSGEKPWKCEKCDACFTEKKSMERHSLIHTGLKLFVCGVCGKSLSTAWSLKQHALQHEGQPEGSFLCDICGKTFPVKNKLQSHKKIHLADRPYPCTLCKRSFYGKGDLDRHMRSHTGEKPYDCRVCSKRFSRLEYLKEHLNAHAGAMPYSCPTCAKGFTDRSGYHKHSKRCAIKKNNAKREEEEEEKEEQEPEEMEDEDVSIGTREVDVQFDQSPLDTDQNQVSFISLDPPTTDLQVHEIFCTNQETPGTVTADQIIELAPSASRYTVLTDDQVPESAISDFVCHQEVPLSVEGAVETIQNEANLPTANLQWYVQDVVNAEPWQGIG